ncbi:MAG: hypothetical protein JWM73_2500 [Solirubrobacterales bacterium]|nr:hypothetical protein [Solirubrobacterales bacterium]
MRKLAGTLLAIAIAVVGTIGLIAFFDSRDSSTTSAGTTTAAPAQGSAPDGNVVVSYTADADGRRLRALAKQLGAPDTPASRAAGQALIVRRGSTAGIIATAGRESITVTDPTDPRLQDFIDRWLGQGASG